jgi:hypothetical protein
LEDFFLKRDRPFIASFAFDCKRIGIDEAWLAIFIPPASAVRVRQSFVYRQTEYDKVIRTSKAPK